MNRTTQCYKESGNVWCYYTKENNPCGCGSNCYHYEYDGTHVIGVCNACKSDIYMIKDEYTQEYLNKGVWKNMNIKKIKDQCVNWIRNWFANNGQNCNAVIGISGGKDSSVAAALLVEALGKDRVYGVLMPNGVQSDIADAEELVKHLDINYTIVNIGDTVNTLRRELRQRSVWMTDQARINLSPRIRMATLYAVAQSLSGRVCNTCNLSEDWIGFSTLFGDAVGDFSPLAKLTSEEVIEIGRYLGLPEYLIIKPPADGLTGKSDEDNFGFTYAVLNKYIRTGVCEDEAVRLKIDEMHARNLFKMRFAPPSFDPNLSIQANY